MAKPNDNKPFHRLTIDLDTGLYKSLKAEATRNERTASKQAKVILLEHFGYSPDGKQAKART